MIQTLWSRILNRVRWSRRRSAFLAVGLGMGLAGCLAGDRNLAAERHFRVDDFGAKGDGFTDDTPAINAAVDAAATVGGVVDFAPVQYLLRRRSNAGQRPAIALRPGVSLDGHGCTLLLDDNCSYIGASPDLTPRAYLDHDVAAGDRRIHVDSTAAFAVGDPVGLRLGDNEWDVRETREIFFTTVAEIADGQELVLATPLTRKMTVATTTAPNRAVVRFRPSDNPLYTGGFISNFNLTHTGRGNPESGIDLRCASGTQISQIKATDPGAGVVLLAYCRGVQVNGIFCDHSSRIGGHPAKGRVLNAWNSSDCLFANVEGHAFAGPFAFFESYCRNLQCVDWQIVNDWTQRAGTPRGSNKLIMVVQGSEVEFDNLHISGDGEGEVVSDSGGTPAHIEFKEPIVTVSGQLKAFNLTQVAAAGLHYQGQAYGPMQQVVREFLLQPAGPQTVLIERVPTGLWRRALVTAPGLVSPQTLQINGQEIRLTPGQPQAELPGVGRIGTDYGSNPPAAGRLLVNTSKLDRPLPILITLEYYPKVKN